MHSVQGEIAAQWATQSAKTGKASAMRFGGKTIYSYGVRVGFIRGKKAYITTRKHSSTTSSHTSTARFAAENAGLEIVYKDFE